MRLNSDEIQGLSEFLVHLLADKKLILKDVRTEDVRTGIYNSIYQDMVHEDRLNEEVRDIMERYDAELKDGRLDYNKLFNMIKQQLIKERKLII